jgi:translation elongation factor EF-4
MMPQDFPDVEFHENLQQPYIHIMVPFQFVSVIVTLVNE